jgi:hypothetical protein
MNGRAETFSYGRPIQRTNPDLIKITGSQTGIGTVGDMANRARGISKSVRNNTVNLHGIGSQNDPVHGDRVTAALRMQVSLEAIDNDQIGDQNTVQLGDSPVQTDAVKRRLHRSGHGPLKVFEATGDEGLIVRLHHGYVDEEVAFKNTSRNLQVFEGALDADRFLDEFIPLQID